MRQKQIQSLVDDVDEIHCQDLGHKDTKGKLRPRSLARGVVGGSKGGQTGA